MHAGYLPGYPASHGCIRMPEFMAENFFSSVSTARRSRSPIRRPPGKSPAPGLHFPFPGDMIVFRLTAP